jgi:hypothetical protein
LFPRISAHSLQQTQTPPRRRHLFGTLDPRRAINEKEREEREREERECVSGREITKEEEEGEVKRTEIERDN